MKKGQKVKMVNCMEADKYPDKVWTLRGDSFKSSSNQEVVFLEGYSGYFSCEFLEVQEEPDYEAMYNEHFNTLDVPKGTDTLSKQYDYTEVMSFAKHCVNSK